ncbi:GGDEF domain-containing protein [Kitasatospora sp. NPDC089797]|uniref:GGDEF domain-containing protein n=1 Tax=Kitasatospora sp. NPDC089797 TaxID=3155298 RepID=UPI00342259FD
MAPAPADLIDRARRHLEAHARTWASELDEDAGPRAAWYVHHDLAALLPLLQETLADRDRLATRLQSARRDPLTGLDTRQAWTERAEQLTAAGPTAVLLVDLDHFKPVNDRHGHAAGDAVLAATAHRLADWCGPAGAAGRLGGDEFVAAVPDHGDLTERVTKLRDALARPVDHQGRLLQVGASLGAARLADLAVPTVSAALEAADAAMYRSKRRGRRGRRWPTPLTLAHTLRRAA